MITLTRKSGETFTVKTVSAAWNLLRNLRNIIPAAQLEGELVLVTVTLQEGTNYDRIPQRILFHQNKKGKMEFKDYDKLLQRIRRRAMGGHLPEIKVKLEEVA